VNSFNSAQGSDNSEASLFLSTRATLATKFIVQITVAGGVAQFLPQELDSTPALLNSLSVLNSSSNDFFATVS